MVLRLCDLSVVFEEEGPLFDGEFASNLSVVDNASFAVDLGVDVAYSLHDDVAADEEFLFSNACSLCVKCLHLAACYNLVVVLCLLAGPHICSCGCGNGFRCQILAYLRWFDDDAILRLDNSFLRGLLGRWLLW